MQEETKYFIETMTDEDFDQAITEFKNRKEGKTEKKRNKLKSVKLWFTIWAAALECLVIWGMIFKGVELTPVALGLLTIVLEFLCINYKQKKLFKNPDNKEV